MSDNNDKNIFQLIKNDNDNEDTKPVEHLYQIYLNDGTVVEDVGFLIFTSQHVAIMSNEDEGTIPATLVPLSQVKYAKLADEDEAPF